MMCWSRYGRCLVLVALLLLPLVLLLLLALPVPVLPVGVAPEQPESTRLSQASSGGISLNLYPSSSLMTCRATRGFSLVRLQVVLLEVVLLEAIEPELTILLSR